jgi:hypothetical protein
MNIKIFLLICIFVSSFNFYDYFFEDFHSILKKIVNNFNYNAIYISKQYEYICLDLMKEIYNKNLLVLNTEYLIDNNYNNYNKNDNDNSKNLFLPSIANIIASGTKSIFFPNLNSFAETFFLTTELLTEYTLHFFYNNNNNYKNSLQKRELNNKLYTLSNIYCLNTFYIHIDMDETNSIIIYGDDIDYSWMIYLLQTLETNIQEVLDYKIKYRYKKQYKKLNKDELISLYERLSKLRNIVQELQIIIHYSFDKMYFKIIDLKLNKETIKYVKEYLDDIIIKMNNMLIDLQKFFPIQENEKRKMIELIKQKYVLYELDYNITHTEKNEKKNKWNKYLLDIRIYFIGICDEYSKIIYTFIQGLSNITISPVFGIINIMGIQLNNLLSLMIFSKNGLTIIGFIIFICNLANIISLIGYIIIHFFRKFIFE